MQMTEQCCFIYRISDPDGQSIIPEPRPEGVTVRAFTRTNQFAGDLRYIRPRCLYPARSLGREPSCRKVT